MHRRIRSQRSCRKLASHLAILVLLGGLANCHPHTLHRSYGLRYREVMAAQANAHPSRDATARGEEAAKAVHNYFDTFDSPEGGAVGKPIGGGTPTAGVMPMH